MIRTLLQDIRFGARTLRRNPGFAAVALLSLSLGIGASTSVFSVLHAVLIRELPVRDPGRLILVRKLVGDSTFNLFSYPAFLSLAESRGVLDGILGSGDLPLRTVHVGPAPIPGNVTGRSVTRNYFSVLGVGASRGRVFEDGSADPVTVISDRFWTRQFARSAGAVGTTVYLNEVPLTIMGVAPPGFFGDAVGEAPDLFVPVDQVVRIAGPEYVGNARNHWMASIGRLRPGVSARDAEAQLNRLFQQTPEYARTIQRGRQLRVVAEPGSRGLRTARDRFDEPLLVLMTLVGFLLLIACCNVSNLLLARATARRREIGIRIALGAGRGRVVQQLLTESLLLSFAGGAVALWIANIAGPALVALASDPANPIILDSRPDPGVFAFTIAVSLLTTVLFGLLPALQTLNLDVNHELKAGSGGLTAARSRRRLSQSLVAVQVAFSLVLLVGAGLLIRTLWNLRRVDAGFRADNVLLARLSFEISPSGLARLKAAADPLATRVAALPGVQACALSTYAGLARATEIGAVSIPGGVAAEKDCRLNHVAGKYFETYGIRLVAGRTLLPTDTAAAPPVAVINQTTARRLFAGADPLGRRICFAETYDPGKSYEIVGVVRDAKYTDLREEMQPQCFVPIAQGHAPGIYLAARTSGNPRAIVGQLRQVVREVESRTDLAETRTLEENIASTLVQERMMAGVSLLFGVVALALAGIGVYGTMAYAVSRRTREIGIRMAIGADPSLVRRMVLTDVMLVVGAGLAVGLPATLVASRFLTGFLYGLTPHDPATVVVVALFLAAVAAVAAAAPVARAARVDPVTVLRAE